MKPIDQKLFRSLDIRGAEPEYVKSLHASSDSDLSKSAHGAILDQDAAYIIGRAIADSFHAKKVAVGYDARKSSPSLSAALVKGLRRQGTSVDLLGMVSTDQLYYAVGKHKYEIGIVVTGSHTIKYLNGFKIVRYRQGRVFPVAKGLGMEKLKEIAVSADFKPALFRGKIKKIDIKSEYTNFILSHFNPRKMPSQKVVFDAGNGVAGEAYDKIIDSLPVDSIKLNFLPDGNFPNHEPDPFVAENNRQLIGKIKSSEADFGVAWDGDADRIAVISRYGELVTGSFFAPMILPWVLKHYPHSTSVATLSMSQSIREVAEKNNAKIAISPVGNSNVTLTMDLHDAPFAAEEAGHFMFKDTYCAENGIFPLLILMQRMGEEHKTLDQLLCEAKRGYYISGDVNIETHDAKRLLALLLSFYQAEGQSCRMKFGDLEVSTESYHFALHPSFNDQVVRLNLEAKTENDMIKGVLEVKRLVQQLQSINK